MPTRVEPITPYPEPKPAGGVRRMALLSERAARTWQGLADQVAAAVEPRLSPRVLANRTLLRGRSAGPSQLGPALNRARRAAWRLEDRSAAVVRTDVRAFYPSVNPSILFRALQVLSVDRDVAGKVAAILESWGSEGYAGLPIGPPGSAVLANAVLASVDAELESRPFLRWVDDYLIGVPVEADVPRVVERLDEALTRLHLERSESKTSVLSGGSGLVWPGAYVGRSSTSSPAGTC